ncbi:MAG: type I-E CRISPR-associated protein Cse1/CasA [Deltaproteobacteria bacterium]|nr:type I-E CRISPR-associated protein Cse1/CasA [Deltaproteobacteria bacterium]
MSLPDLFHNLLDDRILGIEDDRGHRENVTLPGLLARLSRAEPVELTRLQAHQQHPWHAFLVQLAALALVRANEDEIGHDEPAWRALLLATAAQDGAGPEAFTLVVGDLAKPAFMQPPVPEGSLAALKYAHVRPSSELDVLITAKNHDVKIDRLASPTPEHWVLSLVTLQTMQGFLGRGNYGIARMNGGFSSRSCVAYAPDQGAAARFVRDVRALREARLDLAERGFGKKAALGLVWCAPWDGEMSLPFAAIDPFFVEICRRVRLSADAEGHIVAHRGSSKTARIDAGETYGNTGDAWTPVKREDGKALTMSESGFAYDRVQDLMFGDWKHGAAGQADQGGGDGYWLGQVLVRGQGKTGGYHERWVPVPPRARGFLANRDARAKLGKRAQGWVGLAKTARLNVLKPALLTLLQGAPEKLKFDDDRADPILRKLDAEIDLHFFRLLFEHADEPSEAADSAFQKRLFEVAKVELDRAAASVPLSCARRQRAIAKAYAVLHGAARRQLELAFPPAAAVPAPEAAESQGVVP